MSVVAIAPPFTPAAVVFDLDGLLVDTEDLWEVAERRVVAGYGVEWDPAVRPQLLGRGPDETSAILAAFVGAGDVREVDRRLLQAAVDEFRRGVVARPGVTRLVEALAGRLPIAVATNSRRVLADMALSAAGLSEHVEAVVCLEDVALAKPAPDPYLRACRAVNADPRRSVAFEDSPVGSQSARAAGLWVIGCPSLPTSVLDADVLVASLHDVDPALLLP